jgi:hypothetical protein
LKGRLKEICEGTALINDAPISINEVNTWRARFGIAPVAGTTATALFELTQVNACRIAAGLEAIERLPHQPPVDLSWMVLGWNFFSAITRWTLAGFPICTKRQIQARLKICQSCEHLKNNRCELCGCECRDSDQLLNKLSLATEECPIGKWKAVKGIS